MAILLPQRWRRQPGAAVPVDWSNPLCRGLVLTGFKNAFATDLAANRSQWTLNSAPTHSYTQCGAAWGFNGSTSYLSRADALPATTNRAFTMACLVTPRGALATDRRAFSFGSSTDNLPIATLQTNGTTASSATFWCRSTDNQLTQATLAGEFSEGRESLLIGVLNGTAQALYTRNGSASATAATGAAIPTDRTALGGLLRSTAVSFFQVDVSWWAAWNRPLTADEIRRVLENPWGIFTPQRRRLYAASAAAGGDTVSAATAAHAYNANVPQARVAVAPAQANHTYLGHGPQVNARVAPAQATHSYAGQPPQANVRVAPTHATHSYTGLAPNLAAGGGLSPPVATHSYSALDAQLRAKVSPAPASHTYTGQAPQAQVKVAAAVATHNYSASSPQAKAKIAAPAAAHTYTSQAPGGFGSSVVSVPTLTYTHTAYAVTITVTAPVRGERGPSHYYGQATQRPPNAASVRPTMKPATRPRRN